MTAIEKALRDYYSGIYDKSLLLHNDYGEVEDMPVEVFFREEEDMSELEMTALQMARGRVLDVGAGTGVHSLILQDHGYDVTAIDILPENVAIMKESGVLKTKIADIFTSSFEKYDTIYLLMNGLGIAGKLSGLGLLFDRIVSMLNPGGQFIFDSSDISYLYEGKLLPGNYFGEVRYQYEYDGVKDQWFDWLYVDPQLLMEFGHQRDYYIEILQMDENDQYLARLINDKQN